MTVVKRVFKGKDVEMLTVAETILGHAIAHKELLQAKRSNWADPYFEDFAARIQRFLTDHYGKDVAKDLRETTALVNSLQTSALLELAELKLQIEEDFKKDKVFLANTLRTLGFTEHYDAAAKRSQESLVKLLYAFRQNMSAELKAKIVEKGTNPAYIESVVAKAETLKTANVNQEIYKEQKKDTSKDLNEQLNAIYEEMMNVAKLATKFLKPQGINTDKFNYTSNLNHLTGAASAATVAQKAKAAKSLEPA